MGNGSSTINSPFNSFKDTLNDFLSNGHLQVLLIGIESSGKSSLLQRLKHDHYVEMTPTIGFDSFKMKYKTRNNKSVNIHLWDLGGQDRVRPLWKSFIKCADAVCFVVDASDISKLDEAKMEYNTAYRHFYNCKRKFDSINNKQNFMTSNRLPTLAKGDDVLLPFIVLANKCDLPTNSFVTEKGLNILNDYFYYGTSFQKLREYSEAYILLNYKPYKPTISNHLITQDNLSHNNLYDKQKSLNSTPKRQIFFSSTALSTTPKDLKNRMLDDQHLKTNTDSTKHLAKQFSSTSNLNVIHKTLVTPNGTIMPKAQNNLQTALDNSNSNKQRVYPVCGITGEGIDEAFESLLLLIENYRNKKAKLN